MPDPIRIFLGSSNEARPLAEKLVRLLRGVGKNTVVVRPWWDDDVFPPGDFVITRLTEVMEETDAAILLATADDRTVSRGKRQFTARDNVVLETGMSILAHGLGRTIIATFGRPKVPSDLAGVIHFELDNENGEFKPGNRARICTLLEQWRSSKPEFDVKAVLPKLYESILRVISSFHDECQASELDFLAAAIMDSVAHQFSDDGFGITEMVCKLSTDYLRKAKAIWAVDVLGPPAWLTPTAFRYLALQIRRYFRANIKPNQGLMFSPSVAAAIRRSSENMQKRAGRQSDTKFDDQFAVEGQVSTSDFTWIEGEVGVEFSRILLWTKGELENPITEMIANIHEAVHVPLFALLVRPDAPERQLDFIAFSQPDGAIEGFFNLRKNFVPKQMVGGRIPKHGVCTDHWNRLFSHPELMFAADIHHLLRDHKIVEPAF